MDTLSSSPAVVERRAGLPAWIAALIATLLVLALGFTAWSAGLIPARYSAACPVSAAMPAPVAEPAALSARSGQNSAQSAQINSAQTPNALMLAQQPQAVYAGPALPAPAYAQQTVVACLSCGRVASVRELREQQRTSGVGAAAGAVGGGLLGSAFGHGHGRTGMVLLGALGGGLAGNAVERNMHTRTVWVVGVRMQNGGWKQQIFYNPPPFGIGQPVHFDRGELRAG